MGRACDCELCRLNRQWKQATGKKNIKRIAELYNYVWTAWQREVTARIMADYHKIKKKMR